MLAILALGTTAFVLCLLMTPVCRNIFLRAGIVDRPDTVRRFHARAVPRMGGIPIVLSYVGALAMLYLLAPSGTKIYVQHGALLWAVLPATGLIFLTGLADDIFSLAPKQKLLGQIVAAVLAVSLGARMSLGHGPAWVSLVASVLWLIVCTNAVNLIDGMDGLATGMGLMATLTMLVVALVSHNLGLAMATAPLAGCLFAFLRYNFSPATVFLGDCGSLTIGFMLGCFGLIWSQRTGMFLGMVGPLIALSLPLVDVCLAVGRRYLRNTPIFQGDRSHIHHMVLARGFTTRGAALILYGVCGIAAILAFLISVSTRAFGVPLFAIFCTLSLIGVSRLRYVEFSAARRTFSRKTMLRAVQEEIYLHDLRRSLAAAETIEASWHVIAGACRHLQFATVHMEMNGSSFTEDFQRSADATCCRIQLTLGDSGHLVLTRLPELNSPRIMMAALHHLQEAMEKKYCAAKTEEVSLITAA